MNNLKQTVHIRIKSAFNEETLVLEVQGELYRKQRNDFLRYKEPASAEMGNTMTTMKLGPHEVKIIRHGDVEAEQTYIPLAQTGGTYRSSLGILEMQAYTHYVHHQLVEGRGNVSWSYDLFVAEAFAGTYTITVEIQEVK
jgi:uncharacterized beta-barrel protein YwiB (DUF1934 family)